MIRGRETSEQSAARFLASYGPKGHRRRSTRVRRGQLAVRVRKNIVGATILTVLDAGPMTFTPLYRALDARLEKFGRYVSVTYVRRQLELLERAGLITSSTQGYALAQRDSATNRAA